MDVGRKAKWGMSANMKKNQYRQPFGCKFIACLSLLVGFTALVGAQTLQTLYSFSYTDGANPNALTLGTDGNFYGTTYMFCDYGPLWGTVFKMTTSGTLTTLFSFINYSNGASPNALTLGTDGNFYGTTDSGGNSDYGTVFKMTPNGTLTTLFSFDEVNNGGNFTISDGANPNGLTLGTDGNFYGTTQQGGGTDGLYGTVFKVTTNGTLTTLCLFSGGSDAGFPQAALTLGTDGSFYGTTYFCGSYDYGTVFRVTTNGMLTSLVSFNYTNGANPNAALTLGTDGNFYGTTGSGGSYDYGTVFKMTPTGTLTTLVSFNYTNGASPNAALTLGPDGNFYGTTWYGGSNYYGTVFRLVLPTAPILLNIQLNGSNAVLTWNDPKMQLQASPLLCGLYTNVPNASSPYTTPITGAANFFRLQTQ